MRWLITGGCGFIGTTLIRHLVSTGGHAIRVVDNLSVGTREDLGAVCGFDEIEFSAADSRIPQPDGQSVQLIVGDILDAELALRLGQDIDVIVHLAANTGVEPSVRDPRQDCQTNVLGTLNYLESCRANSIRRFVFASSGAPAGEVEPPIHEEVVPHPVSPYGASKLAGEAYCSAYFRTFAIETVALRFGNVYGPGSTHKNSVVAKFIKQALGHETLEIYGSGDQTRDFIFNGDLVKAIVLAADKEGIGGEIFQIATGAETTVNGLVREMQQVFDQRGIELRTTQAASRVGDVARNYSDTTKARQVLGWHCDVTLRRGLEQTIDWFTGQE